VTPLPAPSAAPEAQARRVRFERPGRPPAVRPADGRIAVLDLAFPAEGAEAVLAWAGDLGERLAAWIDHHDHEAWAAVAGDPRFVLVPRAEAPACPPLVTPERVQGLGPARTLIAHGDLDGVLAAARWLLLEQELPVPAWLDPDSIAADTRSGPLSPRGARLDRALRGLPHKDGLRRALIASVLHEGRGRDEPPELRERIDRAVGVHERVLRATGEVRGRYARLLEDLPGAERACLVDLRPLPGDLRLDLTALMLPLQQEADFVVVLARGRGGRRKIVVSTDPARSGLDLRREFGLQGFAPFRVHVPEAPLLRRLPSPELARVLGRRL